MELPTNECWECRRDVGYSRAQLEQLFELAHKTCPVAPPEQNSSICFDAFRKGGCTEQMYLDCVAETQIEDEQLDSLDEAIASGPDDF